MGMKDERTDRATETHGDAEEKRLSDSRITGPAITPSPDMAVSDLRILLWDIDGTLIRSVRTGAYKVYTIPALEDVFGTSGQLGQMRVSGMTDLQIIGEALHSEGFTHDDIHERLDQLRERFMEEMKEATGNGEQFFEVLPGVPEVGDTPNDVACARHFGARALAVGTGRLFTTEEMLACKPDAWLPDLADVELVLQTLDEL